MSDKTEEERLGFAESYGVEPVIPKDVNFKEVATFVAEMTPIVGDAMAAKEIYDELMKEEPNYPLIAALGGTAVVGLIPGIGDVAAKGLRKVAETYKRLEVDPDAVGMMGGNIRLKPKPKEEDYLTLDNPNYKELRGQVDETSDIKAAETLLDATEEDIAEVRKGQSKNRKQEEAGKRPFAEEAQALEKNEITGKEFREKAFADVEKFTELEELPTFTEIVFALDKNKRAKGIIGLEKSMAQGAKKIAAGDRVMARLDIPAYNNYDVYVPQITFKKEGVKGAESVFSRTMVIEDVKFPTPQKPSFDIARGKENKFPHATINGQVASNPASKKMYTDQEAHDLAKSVFDDPDFVHVGYNPDRGGFFYDRETNMPVFDSPLVVQIGKQIFAKRSGETSAERVAKMRKMDLRKTSPDIKKPTLFSEGGMALEEQMAMNFGDVPDNTIGIDPVSGNEIPMGSTAENVRDDIPSMLSEGEMVIAADVVNYWGVKLFEDLRAQAKMGYAQMEQDGRIGGEPIDEDMGTMGLEMSDLEVMEMPDDMPEVEEAFLGKFFAKLRAANKKAAQQSVRDRFAAAEERKSVDMIKAGTNKKPKFANKAQEMLYNLRNPNRNESSNRRVTLTEKPPTSDDDRSSGTIAEKINFGGDYDKPKKKKAPPKKVKPGGKATPFVDDAPEKEGVNLRSTESFGTKFMRGLGIEGYDEGGQVFQQKGGFDMSEATPIGSTGAVEVTEGMTMEARIYVNDAGHEITIMFANGVPITPIPAGYYPKEETVTPETGVQTGGGGGGSQLPEPPEPINYEELSIDELTKEVKDLQTPPPIPGILGVLFKGAQQRHRAKTMEEIDRRLASEDLAIYEKEYLQNLKEVLEAPQGKGVVGKFIDKLTGQVVEDPNVPTLDGPKYDFMPDSYSITEPYTPEATTPEVTEQGVDDSIDWAAEGAKASKAAAEKAFKNNPVYKQKKQDEFIQAVKDDPDSFLPPTPVQQTQQQRNRTRDAGKSARKTFDAFKNDPSKSKSIARNAPAVQRTESVIRDMERGVQRGFEKGGLAKKKSKKKKSK